MKTLLLAACVCVILGTIVVELINQVIGTILLIAGCAIILYLMRKAS